MRKVKHFFSYFYHKLNFWVHLTSSNDCVHREKSPIYRESFYLCRIIVLRRKG